MHNPSNTQNALDFHAFPYLFIRFRKKKTLHSTTPDF